LEVALGLFQHLYLLLIIWLLEAEVEAVKDKMLGTVVEAAVLVAIAQM
jgi:hypothetical protein